MQDRRSARSTRVRPAGRWRGLVPTKAVRFLSVLLLAILMLVLTAGCAKYNTYFNAKKAFDDAEHERDEAIRLHNDPPKPAGQQKTNYENAARKAQKVLDDYPGHSLTDDALFLQGKAYYRLESYRMSIRKFDLLFTNYPATPYMEEALYLQALNYLLIGAVDRSQDFLELLAKQFPQSNYQAETLKVSGDNSYVLEKWGEAGASYQKYLDKFPDDSERARIGLKLAQCYWELKFFDKAEVVLQEVAKTSLSAELSFRAKLLRARVHVRLGEFEKADLLLGELESEAEIYNSQGNVLLTRAENLVAQGLGDEAAPLLENMPAEWETPDVKARSSEILGNLYLDRGDLEEARIKFQESLRRRDPLDDENRCRILSQTLSDYLAAETALPDAKPDRIPRLKLLQANSMLFGFDRPGQAASLYAEAAADSAADSTSASRALFGAVVVYRDYLDRPDSAQIFADQLEARFPQSPQAYEVRMGTEGDLMDFLLARQYEQQQDRYANLTPEEIENLNALKESDSLADSDRRLRLPGIRRRLIYLARRENILVAPSPELLQAATMRQQKALQGASDAAALAAGDGVPSGAKLPGVTLPRSFLPGVALPGIDQTGTVLADSLMGPLGQSAPDSTRIQRGDNVAPDGTLLVNPAEAKDEAEKEEKKKKKRDPNKFDLR